MSQMRNYKNVLSPEEGLVNHRPSQETEDLLAQVLTYKTIKVFFDGPLSQEDRPLLEILHFKHIILHSEN